jgi:long-chain acyl-CoA synthetase
MRLMEGPNDMGSQRAGRALGYVSTVRAAVLRGDATAAVFQGRSTTWDTVLESASRVAGALQGMGVAPGDRVAVLSANSDQYMALYLAIPWSGGVIVPLNARWSAPEIAFALDDCSPKVAFLGGETSDAIAVLFEQRGIAVVWLNDSKTRGGTSWSEVTAHGPVEGSGRSALDLFGIFYTGGTTGRSKGVMLSHTGIIENCMAMRDRGVAPDGCRMLIVAPLFHLAAIAALTMTMMANGAAVILPAFDPNSVLDVIADEGVSDALLVPTMVQMMLNAPAFDAAKLARVQRLIYGASPMQEAVLDRVMTLAPHVSFFQAYGMTELSCTATLLEPEFHTGAHRAQGRHRGAGRSIANTEVRIADDQGNALPQGEVGEIIVRGPGVMLGYWNQPELTAATVRDGWMHTGDAGRLDELGVLYVLDRIKDMIVSGGENVYSAEVESAIALHAGVAQCAVIGVPDEKLGERVHAVVVARPGHHVAAAEIVEHCRALIAGYKCPRSIELRDTLPLSPAGKVLKIELRAPYWAGQNRNVS